MTTPKALANFSLTVNRISFPYEYVQCFAEARRTGFLAGRSALLFNSTLKIRIPLVTALVHGEGKTAAVRSLCGPARCRGLGDGRLLGRALLHGSHACRLRLQLTNGAIDPRWRWRSLLL